MNYQDWINELGTLLPQQVLSPFNGANPFQDATYNVVIPRAIEYAELMMYRDPDLNFLRTRKTSNGTFGTGVRSFTIPSDIIIVEELAAIVPSSVTNPSVGTRVQFLPTSVDFINAIWPQESVTYKPTIYGPGPYFAMLSDTVSIIAPTPDAAYTVEVTGVYRPTPLAQSATATTYLTNNLPDLFIAASMIYWTGVQKNFGAQADDPRMAISWSTQYETLKKGAAVESARQRAQSAGWSPYTPTSVATPPRN